MSAARIDGKHMKKIQIADTKIFISGVICGLTEEKTTVKKAYHKVKPNTVALSISSEELEGLKRIVSGEEHKYFLSNYEEIYARRLASFGEVKVPPACYETALRLCLKNELPVQAIDMDDDTYTDTFCENISTAQLMRHSLRVKKLKRKKFKADNAEDFVFEWDKEINKLKGFRQVERRREIHMANELADLAGKFDRILSFIELQRANGVYSELEDLLED